LTLARRGSTEAEPSAQYSSIEALLDIDEAIRCGTDGVVLTGWCAAPRSIMPEIRVQHGERVTRLDLGRCIRVDRPDVIEALNQNGDGDVRCGFVAWLPDAIDPIALAGGENLVVELEISNGARVRRTIRPSALDSLAAIKHLLSGIDLRFMDASFAFENVFGPAVSTLNRVRLGVRPGTDVMTYGVLPAKPRFSVIVPVYGRLDFVEYQLAFFSAHSYYATTEFIYVFDDPRQRRDAQTMCRSLFERFRVPFKAVLLDRNVGFAPANNIGLAEARREFVVFLNSDVFPETPDWLRRLARHFASARDIGVAGPMLLFEDGSIQHRGMIFSRLPEFGNFHFAKHLDKGLRPSQESGLQTHASITGACMMMNRSLATKVGGFDEGYVLGDFEDSDVCLKLGELGYRCVIDPTVRLLHLERQSQAAAAERWRMNLTVYNAWRHETRWGETIREDRASASGRKAARVVSRSRPSA
jgi:GT2 family glycosyltransferase